MGNSPQQLQNTISFLNGNISFESGRQTTYQKHVQHPFGVESQVTVTKLCNHPAKLLQLGQKSINQLCKTLHVRCNVICTFQEEVKFGPGLAATGFRSSIICYNDCTKKR